MKINEILNGALEEAAAWQTKKGKNKNGGLNKKGVASYRRQHPGSKLQTAVTTKPSKLKKGSKAAKRRKSFCARMKGMKKKRAGAKTTRDPNSRINKALRKWHCESLDQMNNLITLFEQRVSEIKKGQRDSNGYTKCWPGKHAEGTKKGKHGRVRNCVPNESISAGQTTAGQEGPNFKPKSRKKPLITSKVKSTDNANRGNLVGGN
jgi:hypothetical protein